MEEKLKNSYNETDDTITVSLGDTNIIFENVDNVLKNKNIISEHLIIKESIKLDENNIPLHLFNKVVFFFSNLSSFIFAKREEKFLKKVESRGIDEDMTEEEINARKDYDIYNNFNDKIKEKFSDAVKKAVIEIESGEKKDYSSTDLKDIKSLYREDDFIEKIKRNENSELTLKDITDLKFVTSKILIAKIKYTLVNNPNYYEELRKKYVDDLKVDILKNKLNTTDIKDEVNNLLEETKKQDVLDENKRIDEPIIYNITSDEVNLDKTIKKVDDIVEKHFDNVDTSGSDIKINIDTSKAINDFDRELNLFKNQEENNMSSQLDETIQIPVEEIKEEHKEEKNSENVIKLFKRNNDFFKSLEEKNNIDDIIKEFFSDVSTIIPDENTNIENNNIVKK